MSLDNIDQVDSVGIDRKSGAAVLTIADYWDWVSEKQHLLALQEKLNAYLRFIEDGQIYGAYPQARGRKLVIDIVGKHLLPPAAAPFLAQASRAAGHIGVTIESRHIPDRKRGLDSKA